MAETAGDLTFGFDADFSGLTRAAEGAGRTLDDLGRRAAAWSEGAAASLSKPFDDAAAGPLRLTAGLSRAVAALRTRPAAPVTITPAGGAGDDDASAAKELAHLTDQLALLRTTGAAHDAILERMKIETEQAKLGTDATAAQRQAVAGLVTAIDTAKAAQTTLSQEQAATNAAWRSGSTQVAQGLESLILDGARLQNVVRSLLSGFARQGLNAALTGTGSLAGVFGTAGSNGQVGGLFGAIQSLFGGGLGAKAVQGGPATAADPTFAGLYASGGSIAAGQWGIAGEKGAEVVAGPATVVPLGTTGSMRSTPAAATHQTINFNVTSPDAPSFARSEGQMSALLSRLVSRGQRNA